MSILKDSNKKCGLPTVISEHRLYQNYEFDWENVKILDESSYVKRSVSEMTHIKKQTLGLNRQSDTELLLDACLPILEDLSPT